MGNSFKEKIRNGKIPAPTNKKFNIKNWHTEWEKVKGEASEDDKSIYEAGTIINELLSEIRSTLGEAFKTHAPQIKNSTYLKILFSISNRDTSIIKNIGKKQPEGLTDTLNIISTDNVNGSELTLDEMAHSAVDGLEKAIEFCIDRNLKEKELTAGTKPVPIIEFLPYELYLSQIYGAYEGYWDAILWGDYELIEHDKKNKVYEFKQKPTPSEIAYLTSSSRKLRLAAQDAGIVTHKTFLEINKKDKYISPTGQGKRKGFSVAEIEKADIQLQAKNSYLNLCIIRLENEFPETLLNQKTPQKFTVKEAIEIFRILSLLALTYEEKYPKDASFNNINRLMEFCPLANKTKLIEAIRQATEFNVETIESVIEFLKFKGKSTDIWCHPIAEVENNKIYFLTSALSTPVITRLVERWLSELEIEMTPKGGRYETHALQKLNSTIKKNHLLNDYNEAVSGIVNGTNESEEIDILLRIGRKVLVGEVKSIVTTDSPISHFRTLETLTHAAKQAKRKTEFVKRNYRKISEHLKWPIESDSTTDFIPFIINSNKIHSGFNIDDVPVIDENILTRYFEDGIFPILSQFHEEPIKHLAWFNIYKTAEQLEDNIRKYLENPPQTLIIRDNNKYKTVAIPDGGENSYKISFTTLIQGQIKIQDIIKKSYTFKIETADNFESQTKDMLYLI